ncbi:MAG: flippase, partial [Anaerolineae bacterium]|nr:flippase [Anaerolineae bacterium]
AARAWPQLAIPLADRAVARLARASEAFADGRMFLSYQARNLVIFAGCALGAGAVLLTARRALAGTRARPLWALGLLAVLFLDPLAWFRGLMPAISAAPLSLKTPAIDYLQQERQPFRITVYDTRSTKPLPANTNMLYGLHDVRGYDSIIPRQYCEVMELVGPQELLYNQIARLTQEGSLDSPILDLLNVRYVLTEERIERRGYTLVHEGDLCIYRNDDALPRAFVTFQARVFPDRASLLAALPQADPREAVLLEQAPPGWSPPVVAPAAPEVTFVELSPNQIRLHVDMPAPGFLVLADNYFPGWVAYTSPDATGEEQALEILRADGTVRAVLLPAGPQTVRFKYSPGSLKTGLFLSFLAGVSLLLVAGAWVWAAAFRPSSEEAAPRRVARNTVVPLALQLLNKGVDMAFAMLMLRLLGPGDAGKYAFAVYVAVLLEVLTNFGLNTLLTREVARNRDDANAYLWNTTVLRLGLAAATAPLLGLFLVIYRPAGDTALAIVLLALGLVPSSISAGLSAVFMAFEVMVIPAVVSAVTTLLKVGLGAVVLLLGWGFVGLAGTSIVVNAITAGILLALVAALFFRPRPDRRPGLPRRMALEAYPLMINHLLATLFFKVDYLLLERMWGSAVVGWYSVSYKLVDAIGIIPPTFTMAIFPIMSRFASSSRESLYRAYTLSIKLLFSLGLLIALLCTVLAYPLTRLIGGGAYLPHSAIAIQLIVWYMPLGFVNSVTQYVLIALDQQRFLTKAFAIGLACGVAANLVLIPSFGYRAAAAVHVFSELALLVPFYVGVRRHLAPIPWLRLTWRPAAAAAAVALVSWLLAAHSRLLVATLGAVAYLALLLALGTFDAEDRALLLQVVPAGRLLLHVRQRLEPRQPELPPP